MSENNRLVTSFTDVLVKYMNKNMEVKLITRNGFQTRGTITAVYSDGLQFLDLDGNVNEIPLGALSTVMI